jgi:hypothetical protein
VVRDFQDEGSQESKVDNIAMRQAESALAKREARVDESRETLFLFASPLPAPLLAVSQSSTMLWARRDARTGGAVQLGTIAQLLRWGGGGTGSAVVGGIVGGDMNAIVPSDGMLPEQNGLVDAW